MKKILLAFTLLCISMSTIYAWNGIIAENWDMITLAKWNQMVSTLSNKLDISSISDSTTNSGTIWSSQKIQNEINTIGGLSISDSTTNTGALWSSTKIQSEINTKLSNTSLSDATTSTSSLWSSDKIQNEIDAIDTSIKVARINITSQNNLNNSTNYTTISLNNMSINTIWASIASNQINLPAGTYEFHVEISVNGSVTRWNLWLASYVNGSIYSQKYWEWYTRNSSGHNETSITHSDVFILPSLGNIRFGANRLANSGTYTTQPNFSRIIIKKLD